MVFHDVTQNEVEEVAKEVSSSQIDTGSDEQTQKRVSHQPRATKPGPARNVVLVGMTGAGKSSVGRYLATHIGLGFIDTDEEIEKAAGKSIPEIFKQDGEKVFRQLERSTILSLKGIRNHVIAVGGGAVAEDSNWDKLRRIGLTIWLNCEPEDIANRLLERREQVSFRPLLADIFEVNDETQRRNMLIAKLKQFLSERSSRYSEANLEVRFGYVSAETCALNMIPLLRKKGVVRSHMGLSKHLFATKKV